MMKMRVLGTACALFWTATFAQAAMITEVLEFGLGADAAAIIATDFGEDQLTFSDRDHQHNGAAFDSAGLLTTPTGPTIVPLPDYLTGFDYVRFANNARDQSNYRATVIADEPVTWYLLVDNRVNGPEGNTSSPNTTDPVLGGTLQWVIDGQWERVNTGISPNGQADYTAVDEGGNGVGAGQELNQFYSVYKFPLDINVVTVFNNGTGGSNMVSLVAVPEPSTGLLFTGMFGLVLARLRRRRR